jgi:uncharacterized RDD family membrane protein YckC
MNLNKAPYAGLGRRGAALALDGLLFCLVFFPVTRVVKGVWIMSPADHQWSYGWFITDPLCIIFLAVIAVYFIVLEGIYGATLGKYLVGLQVVTAAGAPGLWKSTQRNLLRLVDALPVFSILGIVLIATSADRTRVGDRVAGTRVIRTASPSRSA